MSRGRGRGNGGRREMSGLHTELMRSTKFGKTDATAAQPLFPEYEFQPNRAPSKEEANVARLMEEFQQEVRSSVFYLKPPLSPPDVERYSDRYLKADEAPKSLKELKTDIHLFPEELHSVLLKKRTKKARAAVDDNASVMAALRNAKDDDSDSDKSGKEDDEELELEGEEEEDEEEGNDYMDSYFDNGEEDDGGDIDDDDGGGDY
ncbi:hypothetical protein LPJ66_000348 [Kickxella alabastrina]|uniref:Uncharacterized protein n=1 Tax=Kickxella alabastrina TaxID=61397 RepID=A0ACC1IWC8_9FUNG|nr:hypothetical protein LPJ66_000348 [Kickxella alabastrina]